MVLSRIGEKRHSAATEIQARWRGISERVRWRRKHSAATDDEMMRFAIDILTWVAVQNAKSNVSSIIIKGNSTPSSCEDGEEEI